MIKNSAVDTPTTSLNLLDLGRLTEVMNANPVPCFVIDAAHRVVHWNKGCELVLGISAEKMLGSKDQWQAFYDLPRPTLADLVIDKQAEDLENNLYRSKNLRPSQVLAGAFEAEDFFPSLGNDGRWLYFTSAPIRDENGNIIGAVETLQDITTQRRAEIALQASHDELEKRVAERTAELAETNNKLAASLHAAQEINRLKTAFLATVSHELKTPMNSIIGFSDLLIMDHPDDSVGEYARLINLSGKSLYQLIANMLVLTEIEAGEAEITINPCSTTEMIDGLVQEFSIPASQRGISLITHYPENLSPIITTDTRRVRDALGALIDNAIRYMDKDNGRVEISVQNDETGFHVCIADNGPGIPPEAESLIFERFRQLENYETRGHEGMGLGLSLAKAQVELLGGSITLKPHVKDKGAEFLFSIPCLTEHKV